MTAREAGGDFEQLLARWHARDALPPTPALTQRLQALRAWQAARLAQTYRDLAREPRYAAAVTFFLSDLYGPQDFSRRDHELERALRPLRRALPASLLVVLAKAIELDLLTLELDQAMLAHLAEHPLTDAAYAAAYRALGRVAARRRQIALTVGIGEDLERLVQHRWIGVALRAAAVPARAADFGRLQEFLERGFAAFRRMGDAQGLLEAIRDRETRLMEGLMSGTGTVAALAEGDGPAHG